jgi:hypothetical protein
MEPWIFIPFFVTLAPVALVYLLLTYRQRLAQARYHTLLQLADKGVELPHELLVQSNAPFCERRRGLVLVSAGVGIMCTLVALPFEVDGGRSLASLWGLGLLPVLTGLGYLLSWWLSRGDRAHA